MPYEVSIWEGEKNGNPTYRLEVNQQSPYWALVAVLKELYPDKSIIINAEVVDPSGNMKPYNRLLLK